MADLSEEKRAEILAHFSKLASFNESLSDFSNLTDQGYQTLLQQLTDIKSSINMTLQSGLPPLRSDPIQEIITNQCDYCCGSVRTVVEGYNSVHGYVCLVVCIFGCVANLLNIAVLTRRDMASAPINRILKWLAATDLLVMAEYVPFATYNYLIRRRSDNHEFPYSWAAYLLWHAHFAQVMHTVSICLTLSLAIWRYIAIRYPHLNGTLCTERRCSCAILLSFFLPPLLCAPTYLVFNIREAHVYENSTEHVLYHVHTISDLDRTPYIANFWFHGVVIKLLPCIVLTVISCWLIRALYGANKHKRRLLSGYNSVRRTVKSDKRTDRTTKMLVAVLLLFLITEIPQGILGLLSGILGQEFFVQCYHLFGELMDFLALINGAINFILYCSMSRQFRTTFGQLFKPSSVLAKFPAATSHQNGRHVSQSQEVQSTVI